MLERKIYSELLKWKEKRKTEEIRKCLIVKGARQVGKTYIIRKFGLKEYASFISINLIANRNGISGMKETLPHYMVMFL